MCNILRGIHNQSPRKMKVLAFNASPRKSQGTTDILMEAFIAGAKRAKAEVEKHHIVDLNINGCLSCFSCWWKTPGKCVHRDDMDWILPKIPEADIMLLGTPIYGRNVTHYLQRLLERTFSFSLPEMEVKDGETTHPGRIRKFPQLVLCATCGFPDTSNFGIVRALYQGGVEILLPAAQMLFNEDGREQLSGFLQAIELAGQKMAKGEEIPQSLRDQLVVEYSDEMKKGIIESHNLYSASRLE
ncbi:flavodoxin family protein [Candidatus Thorarchaeota archaeon]|nr:MAG: flavodoxin family protein [Candidatus Thorarchaeota archaeon]